MTPRHAVVLGAVFGALAVAAGAFGAHALRDRLEPRDLEVFELAVRYQLHHALALVACGLLPAPAARWPARWFAAGIVVFSGSLYALVLADLRWLGAVTPLGGTALILGWIALAVAAWRGRGDQAL